MKASRGVEKLPPVRLQKGSNLLASISRVLEDAPPPTVLRSQTRAVTSTVPHIKKPFSQPRNRTVHDEPAGRLLYGVRSSLLTMDSRSPDHACVSTSHPRQQFHRPHENTSEEISVSAVDVTNLCPMLDPDEMARQDDTTSNTYGRHHSDDAERIVSPLPTWRAPADSPLHPTNITKAIIMSKSESPSSEDRTRFSSGHDSAHTTRTLDDCASRIAQLLPFRAPYSPQMDLIEQRFPTTHAMAPIDRIQAVHRCRLLTSNTKVHRIAEQRSEIQFMRLPPPSPFASQESREALGRYVPNAVALRQTPEPFRFTPYEKRMKGPSPLKLLCSHHGSGGSCPPDRALSPSAAIIWTHQSVGRQALRATTAEGFQEQEHDEIGSPTESNTRPQVISPVSSPAPRSLFLAPSDQVTEDPRHRAATISRGATGAGRGAQNNEASVGPFSTDLDTSQSLGMSHLSATFVSSRSSPVSVFTSPASFSEQSFTHRLEAVCQSIDSRMESRLRERRAADGDLSDAVAVLVRIIRPQWGKEGRRKKDVHNHFFMHFKRHLRSLLRWAIGQTLLKIRKNYAALVDEARAELERRKKEKKNKENAAVLSQRVAAASDLLKEIATTIKMPKRDQEQLVQTFTAERYFQLRTAFEFICGSPNMVLSLKELQTLAATTNATVDFSLYRRIDIDRGGYLEFDEILHCLFPTIPMKQLNLQMRAFDDEGRVVSTWRKSIANAHAAAAEAAKAKLLAASARRDSNSIVSAEAVDDLEARIDEGDITLLSQDSQAQIQRLFRAADRDSKGYLTREDMLRQFIPTFLPVRESYWFDEYFLTPSQKQEHEDEHRQYGSSSRRRISSLRNRRGSHVRMSGKGGPHLFGNPKQHPHHQGDHGEGERSPAGAAIPDDMPYLSLEAFTDMMKFSFPPFKGSLEVRFRQWDPIPASALPPEIHELQQRLASKPGYIM